MQPRHTEQMLLEGRCRLSRLACCCLLYSQKEHDMLDSLTLHLGRHGKYTALSAKRMSLSTFTPPCRE